MNSNRTTLEGPVHPTPGEYPAFLKFLSRCYGFDDPRWFEKDAPFFFGKSPSQLRTKWTFKIGGRFAAHVGLFPFTALVEGRSLKVAGIGAVATDTDFRGRGLMKQLMGEVERQIGQGGFDLAILWGERGLYKPYGYERALPMDQFTFTKRHLKYFAAPKGIRPARSSDFAFLPRLFSGHPLHVQRTPAYSRSIYRRFRQTLPEPVWVLEEKGKVVAYSVFLKPASGGLEVAEWGGESEDVACLWATFLHRRNEDFLTAAIHSGDKFYEWALENHSNQSRTTQSCMLKPLNPLKVLKAFEPQLQRRYRNLGMNFRKAFNLQTEDGQAVGLELGVKLQIVPVSPKAIPITLSTHDLTRFLWGMGRPVEILKNLPLEAGLLDSLFPLQWYWWRSDWI